MSPRSESLENLIKIINRGISKRIDEIELYRDTAFINHFNSLSTSEHSSKERFSTEKFIVSAVDKNEKEIREALKNLYFPDEDNVILFNYISNKTDHPGSKKYIQSLLKNLSIKDSPIQFLDGFSETMGKVLAGAISQNMRPVTFFRENDESYISLTLCFLEEKDLPKLAGILSNIHFQNLGAQIPNILDIFLTGGNSLSEAKFSFLEKFCKQSNQNSYIFETILLYLYESKNTDSYKTFKEKVSKKLTPNYSIKKAHKAIEIGDVEGLNTTLSELNWNKHRNEILRIYFSAIRKNLFDLKSMGEMEGSYNTFLLRMGIYISGRSGDQNLKKQFESSQSKLIEDKNLSDFEKEYSSILLNLSPELANSEKIRLFQPIISKLKINSQASYHLTLLLYILFLLDEEELYDEIFPATLKKMNQNYEQSEATSILWFFISYSRLKDKLTNIANFFYTSDISLYIDYNNKQTKINPTEIRKNLSSYLEAFNSNYEKFILESLDSSVEVSNIFNDIRNYNYKYTQSIETATAAKKILFEDIDFFMDSIYNVKSHREKVKLICNFFNHYFNNSLQIKNKKLEQFHISHAQSLTEVNPEFGARVLGSMFLYSILFDNEKLYNISIKLIKKQKKHKTDENKNFFYAWEQQMLLSLAGINNLQDTHFKKLCNWILNDSNSLNLSSWFVTGFTREFYFFVLKNHSEDREFLLKVVEKLQSLISIYPESIQHIKFYNFVSSIFYYFKDITKSNVSIQKSIEGIKNTRLSDQWKDHLLNDTVIQCFRTGNLSLASGLLKEVIDFSLTKKVNTYLVETLDYILSKAMDVNIVTPYLDSIKEYCINYYPHNHRLILSFSKILLKMNKKEDSFSLLSNSSEDMQAEFMDKFLEFIYSNNLNITPTEILNLMNVNSFSYLSYIKAVIFLLNRSVMYDLEFLKLLSGCSIYYFELENIISAFVLKRAFDLSLEDEYSDSLRRII